MSFVDLMRLYYLERFGRRMLLRTTYGRIISSHFSLFGV